MEFNLKNYLITGTLLVGSLLGYSQNKESPTFASKLDSLVYESEKCPTTTHFFYELFKDSKEFHDVNKLERIITRVEKKCEKKTKYSKEEAIEILKATAEEIKNEGLKPEEYKFDCDDLSCIYLAVGEKFNLPLYGVVWGRFLPEGGHMYVRYDPDGKHDPLNPDNPINKGDFNWETTGGGWCCPTDSYYIETLSVKNPKELKNVKKSELIIDALWRIQKVYILLE